MTWCSKSEWHVVTHIDIEPRQRHDIRPRLWVEYVWIYHFGLRLSSGAEDTSVVGRREEMGVALLSLFSPLLPAAAAEAEAVAVENIPMLVATDRA